MPYMAWESGPVYIEIEVIIPSQIHTLTLTLLSSLSLSLSLKNYKDKMESWEKVPSVPEWTDITYFIQTNL